MAVSVWRPLVVDRLAICKSIKEKTVYGYGIKNIYEAIKAQKNLVPSGNMTIKKYDYGARLNYYPEKGRKVADLTVGMNQTGHRFFRLGLSPSKFKGAEFSQFQGFLKQYFNIFNYETLYSKGKVTYLELAADSLSYPTAVLVPFKELTNKSRVHDPLDPGSTVWLGATASDLRYCVYDKNKQLNESGQWTESKIRTRFESRSRGVGLSPYELAQFKNPFKQLEIAVLPAAGLLTDELAVFIKQCKAFGSPHALSLQTKQKRAEYLKALRSMKAPWWKPDSIWQSYSNALLAILPVADLI